MFSRVGMEDHLGLPLVEFENQALLRDWLVANHTASKGVWVRVYKVVSSQPSVTFEELLDQGLCFGWSESLRHKGDAHSYLQKFTSAKVHVCKSSRPDGAGAQLRSEIWITRKS